MKNPKKVKKLTQNEKNGEKEHGNRKQHRKKMRITAEKRINKGKPIGKDHGKKDPTYYYIGLKTAWGREKK